VRRIASSVAAAGLATGVFLGGGALQASAETSFSGGCTGSGKATFAHPVTNTAADNSYDFFGSGTCSGTLNGQSISDDPFSARMVGAFHGSCLQAQSTGPGWGVGMFGREHVLLLFTQQFVSAGPMLQFSFAGQKSGGGIGFATYLTPSTPPTALTDCFGSGDPWLPFQAQTRTDETMVSDSSLGGEGSAQTEPRSASGSGSPHPAALRVLPAGLRRVARGGLRVICIAPPATRCHLRASVSDAVRRRWHRSSATIGSGSVVVPDGTTRAVAVIPIARSARSLLARSKSLWIAVSGRAGTTPFVGGARLSRG
jgi:hypothetical protein